MKSRLKCICIEKYKVCFQPAMQRLVGLSDCVEMDPGLPSSLSVDGLSCAVKVLLQWSTPRNRL